MIADQKPIRLRKEVLTMTKKEFSKWQKENPIVFHDGANGLYGSIEINGILYSVCGAPDQNKRTQKTYIKTRLAEKMSELLEIEA